MTAFDIKQRRTKFKYKLEFEFGDVIACVDRVHIIICSGDKNRLILVPENLLNIIFLNKGRTAVEDAVAQAIRHLFI